ncbi:MAG: PGF-CTERM archaeal protein-sorting signal, partial [uncultured archaeon A07HR60]
YTVVVTATNRFGGESTRTRTVTVDNSPPIVENVRLGADVTNDVVTVRADISAVNSSVDEVAFGVRSTFAPFQTTPKTATISGTAGTVEAEIDVTTLPADGEYTGVVVATDTAGNQNETIDDTVTVDTTAPVVQTQITDLGTDPATVSLSANEDVTVTKFTATADSQPRETTSLTTRFDSGFSLTFDGSDTSGNETTYQTRLELEDKAGNTVVSTANSSIISNPVDQNGTVEFDPPGVGLNTSVNTTEDEGTVVSAEFTQTQSPPENTQPDSTQVTGNGFIDADPGVSNGQVEEATIEIPADSELASVPGFRTDEVTIIRSQEGERGFEPVPTTLENGTLTTTVSGFSQFAVAGTADDPPSITASNVEQTAERDGEITETVIFEYEPADRAISRIDIGETELTASVDEPRVTRRVNSTRARIDIADTSPRETVTVSIEVVDTRGNIETETVTVNPPTRRIETDPDTVFSVSDLSPGTVEITRGEEITVSATITTSDTLAATRDVELRFDGETIATQEVFLDNRQNTTVEFSAIETTGLEGDVEYGVFTQDDSETGILRVTAGEETPAETPTPTEVPADPATETPTETPTEPSTESSTETPTPTEDGIPGFGAVIALLALLVAALIARRRG